MTENRDERLHNVETTVADPGAESPAASAVTEDDLPPGNHALEVAARRGIGPLSPLGRHIWHGETRPCPSCGQLVCRDDDICQDCGQDLDEEMLERMRAHAGPWYVLEHVRPFPGVRFERLVRQVQRGVLTETSIVRGPTTDHQWRFAVETPGLSRYFGHCWECYGEITMQDLCCPACLARQDGLREGPLPAARPSPGGAAHSAARAAAATASNGKPDTAAPGGAYALMPSKSESHTADRPSQIGAAAGAPRSGGPVTATADPLTELSAAIDMTDEAAGGFSDDTPRICGIRATWVVVVVMAVALSALVLLVQSRQQIGRTPPPPAVSTPRLAP
ncbi:MAG: hypothetical protein C4547_12395 [Phycisphaerales bacterium]|nr:MAG: hypothetical protein C4547_12395 [Phycisphaerales bacterium]